MGKVGERETEGVTWLSRGIVLPVQWRRQRQAENHGNVYVHGMDGNILNIWFSALETRSRGANDHTQKNMTIFGKFPRASKHWSGSQTFILPSTIKLERYLPRT